MWARHPVLLGWWLALLGLFGLGFVIESELCFIIPFFGTMIVSVFTYRAVRPGVLVRRGLYYVLVGSLLLSSATTVVAAGSTLIIASGGGIPVVGFTALGLMNLIIVIIAWRSLVHPEAKRAARAGMLAVVMEFVAMLVDIVMNHRVPEFNRNDVWIGIALYAAMISMGTGALACIAAVSAFDPPDDHEIPAARVVDETP